MSAVSKPLRASIQAVGIAGPGLDGWQNSQTILSGNSEWRAEALDKYAPPRLPRNERRRATRLARLAFRAADEAVEGCSDEQLQRLATVFASSEGDMDVVDSVSRGLTQPERPISPTQFHNSVHNSPAGYWSIATASQRPTSSLSAFDDTVVAGLIEAMLLLASGEKEVLLLCYDICPPAPLLAARPLLEDLAVALRLGPAEDAGMATLSVALGEADALPLPPSIAPLSSGNPAGQALPILAALAGSQLPQPFGLGIEQRIVIELS